MLQIIAEGVRLDLPQDIEIEYRLENPLMETDRITVPYSQSVSIPSTVHNIKALGFSNRITCASSYLAKRKVTVIFSSITIITGEIYILEVAKNYISIQLSGVILPNNMKKKLHEFDFGTDSFPIDSKIRPDRLDSSRTKSLISDLFTERAGESSPDIVAATVSIKGSSATFNEDVPKDSFVNQRTCLANCYRSGYADDSFSYKGYYMMPNSQGFRGRTGVLTKILPAFSIGFILRKILPQISVGEISNNELARVMVLSNYHPKYQTEDDNITCDISTEKLSANMHYADFMPDISAVDFIVEMSRLACMTLFINNNTVTWESNGDIINNDNVITMNLIDDYSLSMEEGKRYNFTVQNDYNQNVSTDGVSIYSVNSINDMLADADKITSVSVDGDTIRNYIVKLTEQVFELLPDSSLSKQDGETIYPYWRAKLKGQSIVEQNEPDDERDTFDMNFNGKICNTIVAEYLSDDAHYLPRIDENNKSLQERLYIPEISIEMKDGKPVRGSSLTVGVYNGMRPGPPIAASSTIRTITYPQISHSGYLPDGTCISDVILSPNYLIERYHKSYKEWVEKDKKTLKGRVLLTPVEMGQLDLRRKVYINGRNFLIRSISIIITNQELRPADVDFIEA